MYIQCTKKLLAKLEDSCQNFFPIPDPQYCWHANVFDLYGDDYAVVLHDISGYVVFFKVRDFFDFEMQLVAEMETALEDAGLPRDTIDEYMMKSGPLLFGPTSGPSAVGRLNNAVRMMKDYLAKSEDTAYLRAQEDEDVLPMVHLDVELLLFGSDKVKRSFFVPLHINFLTLHEILQIGFGWTDDHLHAFSCNKGRVRIDAGLLEMTCSDMGKDTKRELFNEEGGLLSDYIPATKRLDYEYDFGDSWVHVITVGAIELIEREPYATCTGGEGSTPPEDCGGPYGYAELRAILKDPTHESYEDKLEWVGDEPDLGFDQGDINFQLKRLKPFTELL